jgi:hypothetical protein
MVFPLFPVFRGEVGRGTNVELRDVRRTPRKIRELRNSMLAPLPALSPEYREEGS